ncbi:MAG: hypothetical protein ACYTAF_08100 [Planctomycetota bacterium]|jgi:hypothetical protein
MQEEEALREIPEGLFQAAAGFLTVEMIFLGAILMAVAGLGILYMMMIMAPSVTERCTGSLREKNFLSFLVGFPVFFGMGTVVSLCGSAGPGLQAMSGVVIGFLLLLGWASASEDIGRRLFWMSGREGSRATHLAVGWLVFTCASCFPFLGWFLIFPYVTLSGVGSLAVGVFRKPGEAELKDSRKWDAERRV